MSQDTAEQPQVAAPPRSRVKALVAKLKGVTRKHADAKPMPTALVAYLSGALVLLFTGALKLVKALSVTQGNGAFGDMALVLCADIAVACVITAIWMVMVRASRKSRGFAWTFGVLSSLLLVALLVLAAVEHQAWARSSSLLDWKMFLYTFEHYQELRSVIASETTVGGVLLLTAGGVLPLLVWLTDFIVARRFAKAPQVRWGVALGALGCALPLAWVATGKPAAAELYPLTQSAPIGLLSGAFDSSGQAHGSARFVAPDVENTKQRIQQALEAANLTVNGGADKPKNVLLVILESTRYDATSVYVPRLDNTPVLNELSQRGAVVERAYVDMPHTSKALVSVICGYSPRWSVEVTEAEPSGLTRPCLPHVFGKLGYRRGFFQAATGTYESRHQFAINAGYEEVFTRESYDASGFEETNYLSVEDKVMVKPIRRWLEKNGKSPFFLTVLTCITHHSYGLPTNFPLREFPRQPANLGARMPRPWADYNRYLNTVQYADQFLGELVNNLKALNQLDDTLIVVVGDHGQGFYEHGQKAHNTVIWDEGVHVPLVISNPKLFSEKRVVTGVRRQLDAAPTMLSQIGAQFPADMFEGRNLLDPIPHERAYSSCWYDNRCAAETSDRVRVIDHYDNQPMEVYDLIDDPYERRNLRLVGTPEERAKWDQVAQEARTRIRAHAEEVEKRYDEANLDGHEFLLTERPKPAHPVHAQLEDSIELLGYDTPTQDVVPDGFWDAVVYFKCLKPSPPGWRLFGVLETLDGRSEQVDHHPGNNRLYLHQCKEGQYIADHIRVWIPGDYPPGQLRYFWGSVLLKDLGHVTRDNRRIGRRDINPLERGILVRDRALLLATLNVKPQYRPELTELLASSVHEKEPKLVNRMEFHFGDNLVLVDAQVEPDKVRPLSSLTVRTVWRVNGEQDGPWQIMTHMDSNTTGYWSRPTHPPVDGIHPIAQWKPGTWVVDTYAMPVPDYMPLGDAKIWVGLRTPNSRMRVTDKNGAEVEQRRVLIGEIRVTR